MKLVPQLLSSDVRKPTALVYFERDLSLLEQKVMTLIIFHCQLSQKDEKGFFYIKKSFIRELIGWEESNNYPRIYEVFESIFDNSIKWNFFGIDRKFKGLKCKLIVSLIEPSETGQYIGFQLHPDLEKLIRDPKLFAKLKLIMMALLSKPKYCYPLYELVADCYSRGQRSIKIELPLLKDYLGIPRDSYGVFKDFKTRVLKPSIEKLNENSDYRVSYKTYRDGRVVGGVVLEIDKQPWQPPLLIGPLKELQSYYSDPVATTVIEATPTLSPDEIAFVESVAAYKISEADAVQAIEKHGIEAASEIRDYVLTEVSKRRGKQGEVRDLGAYMARCLREGFGKQTEEERQKVQRRKVAQDIKKRQEQAREKIAETVEKLKKDFWAYQMDLVEKKLQKLEGQDRADLDQRFMRSDRIWGKRYRECGLDTPMVRSAFYQFIVNEFLDEKQKDIVAFAKDKGFPVEVINLLQIV